MQKSISTTQSKIVQFSSHYLSSGRSREFKNRRKFQKFALRVATVTYERWSLTRASNNRKYSDLIWKGLVLY